MQPIEKTAGQKFGNDRLETYHTLMKHLTAEQLAHAVHAFVLTTKTPFLPMPAELLTLALDHTIGQALDADAAWGDLLKLVKVYGYYQQEHAMAAMDEATAYGVRACGGFLELCDLTEDNKGQYRKSFRDAYNAFQGRRKQSLLTGQPVKLLTETPRQERPMQVFPDTRSTSPVKRLAESLQLPETRSTSPVKSVDDYAAEAEESRRLQKSKAAEMLRLTGGDQ